MQPTLAEQIAHLAATALDAEALARQALELLLPAFGADAGEITLPTADGISPRVARIGDLSRARAQSLLSTPLLARGELVAELAIWSQRPGLFDEDAARRLKSAAVPLGPSLRLLRTCPERDTERIQLELSALHRLADTGARSLDLDEVLGSSLDLALDVTRSSLGVVYLYEKAQSSYRAVLVRNLPPGTYHEELPSTSIDPVLARIEYIERTPQQVIQFAPELAPEAMQRAIEFGVARILLLPLQREQHIVGLLSLQLRATEHFEPTTLHTLRAITRHITVFLDNARAHHSVALRERLASLLRSFAEKVVSPIEPAELYRLVLLTVQEITRCNGALITRLYDSSGRGRVIAGAGRDEVMVGVEIPNIASAILDDSAMTPRALVVEDTSLVPPDTLVGKLARERKTKSFVILTMRHRGEPIGHLFAGNSEPRHWEREELEAVELLGTMTAEVLERERLSALAEAERRVLDATIEDLPIVLAVVDTEGRALHVNRAGRALGPSLLLGVDIDWRDALPRLDIRLPDGTLLPQEDRPLPRALRGDVVLPTEVVMTTPDGISANVLVFAVPISRDLDGRVTAVATGYQDVSALRALADEKDRFLRVASHELRSPLTSLRATTSLLELDPTAVSDPERRATMLQRIRRQIDRLVKLVEQLIDSARVRAELPLEPKECDLVEVAREAIDLAVTANGDPMRRVTLHAAESLPGRWDPLRIEQAVTNLVANALRYSPAASEVEVTLSTSTSTDGERVGITVVDSGIGIPADQIDSVFGPFFRAKNAVAAHRGGLGLGLYITREIVRRHGGAIGVESKPNERTAFVIDLPREVQ